MREAPAQETKESFPDGLSYLTTAAQIDSQYNNDSKLSAFLQYHLKNSMQGATKTQRNIAVFSIITSVASVFVYPHSVWALEGWSDPAKVWLMISTLGANVTLNKFFIELGATDAVDLKSPHIKNIGLKPEGWHLIKKLFVGTLTPLAVIAFVILGKESFLSTISSDWAIVNNIFITPAVAVGYSALMYMSVAGLYDLAASFRHTDIERIGLTVKANLNNRINNLETAFKANELNLPPSARAMLQQMTDFKRNAASWALPTSMLETLLQSDDLGRKHTPLKFTKITTMMIKAFWSINAALTIAGYYGVIVDGLPNEIPISEDGAGVFATISASLFTVLICIMGSNLINSAVDIASILTTPSRRPHQISSLKAILPYAMSVHPKVAVGWLSFLVTVCAGSFGTSLDLQNDVMKEKGLLSSLLNISPAYSTASLITVTVVSNAYGVPDIVEDICKRIIFKADDESTDKLRLLTALKATVKGMSDQQAAVMMLNLISGLDANPINRPNVRAMLDRLGPGIAEALYKHMTQRKSPAASTQNQYFGVESDETIGFSTGPDDQQYEDLKTALSSQLITREQDTRRSCWQTVTGFFGGIRRNIDDSRLGSQLVVINDTRPSV